MFDDRPQLNRIEAKIDHAHQLLHAIADAIAALASANQDNSALVAASTALNKKTAATRAALDDLLARPLSPFLSGESTVPNPTVDAAIAAMQSATSLDDSVLAFLTGVPAMIQAAVDKAIANGATAEQLAPLTQLSSDLTAKTAAVQAALVANTPITPAQAKAKK